MLDSAQLDALTLRASAVHAHAAFPYFERDINRLSSEVMTFPKKSATLGEEPRLMKMPAYLNFFVRYKSPTHDDEAGEEAGKTCRWSRVVRVRQLVDVHREMAEKMKAVADNDNNSEKDAQPPNAAVRERARPAPLELGSASAVTSDSAPASHTFEWRKKIFWVCLEVEGEAAPVALTQLSNKPPTAEEVLAYCHRHAAAYPDQTFVDTPVADDAVLSRAVDVTDPRVYLPTKHQIDFLAAYWKKSFAGHVWTEAEVDEAKELNRRYLPRHAGAAAGPVSATLSHLQNLALETSLGLASSQPLQRANMRGSHAALRDAQASPRRTAPVSSGGAGSVPDSQSFAYLNSASSPLLWTQAGTHATFTDTPQESVILGQDPFIGDNGGHGDEGRDTRVLAPQTETLSQQLMHQQTMWQAGSAEGAAVPRSPFLPRKRLRSSSQVIGSSQSTFSGSPALVAPPPGAASASQPQEASATAAPQRAGHYPASSLELLGGSQSNLSEPQGGGPSAVPSSLTPPQISLSQAELRAWEDARQSEGLFYQYVASPDRGRFINMLATITQRNMEENRRTRLIGIENEKRRVHRMGGFEEGSLAAVRADNGSSGAAAGGQGHADDGNVEGQANDAPADAAPEDAREQALAVFDAKASRELSFESVPDDLFARAEEAAQSMAKASATSPTTTRTRQRRTGANPNMLVLGEAERQDPSLVCSQLVHRSASSVVQSYSQSS